MDDKEINIDLFELINDKYYYDKKELRITKNSQKYTYVRIKGKNRRLHRLIALKYIPNPFNYRVVDHKDADKDNNKTDNLQWTSHSENSKKAYHRNDNMKNMHTSNNDGRKITSEKDDVILYHDSLRKCGSHLNRDVAAVHRCLQGE